MAPTESDARTPVTDSSQPIKRRGLLALAVAAVACLAAKLSEQPVEAGVDGDVVLGVANTTATTTTISSTAPLAPALSLVGNVSNGFGLDAQGGRAGVFGVGSGSSMSSSVGVFGLATEASHIGVDGQSTFGTGVRGRSTDGIPILGQVFPGSSANTIAIYGLNNSTYTGGSPGAGGFAIYGLCAKGHGLVGATAAPGAAAVVGATNGVPGAYAAAFYGPVAVGGNFTVVGGAKSAAVPHPDGSHRRLYCMESPESWFEDFGTRRLECGRAEVTIDPDFAALADTEHAHVFLTEVGEHQALSITTRTRTGFTVEADRANRGVVPRTWQTEH